MGLLHLSFKLPNSADHLQKLIVFLSWGNKFVITFLSMCSHKSPSLSLYLLSIKACLLISAYIPNALEVWYRLYYYTLFHFYPIGRKCIDELDIRLEIPLKLKSTWLIRKVQETIYNMTCIIITFILHACYWWYKFSNILHTHTNTHTHLSQRSSINVKKAWISDIFQTKFLF